MKRTRPEQTVVMVHILRAGQAICGGGLPDGWVAGVKWISFEEVKDFLNTELICKACALQYDGPVEIGNYDAPPAAQGFIDKLLAMPLEERLELTRKINEYVPPGPQNRKWDTAKLDSLLCTMHERVMTGIDEEAAADIPENESVARVIGFWMHRLLECQDGPMPARIERSKNESRV